MKKSYFLGAFFVLAAELFLTSFVASVHAADTDTAGEPHSVSARVVSSLESAGVRVKKIVGQFTVPKGHSAVKFKYHFHDPNRDVTITKLSSSNIYSIKDLDFVPVSGDGSGLVLGPGKYRFAVGGGPGSYGTLSYQIVSDEAPKDDSKPDTPADRVIEVVTWHPSMPEVKTKGVYYVHGTRVTGKFDQTYPSLALNQDRVHSTVPRHTGTFTGTISSNVISGTWKIKMHEQKWNFIGSKGEHFSRVDWGTMTVESRDVLKPGGTVEESLKGTCVSNYRWANRPFKHDDPDTGSNTSDFTLPDKDRPNPATGTWRDVR